MSTYPIMRFNLGNEQVEFRDEDIIEASLVQEIHPLSIELPISTATIRIRTTDNRFSPFSNGSFYQSLSANAAADIWEHALDTEHFLGRFYIQDWHNPIEGEFEFACYDIIGYLDTIPYDGSFWENPTPLFTILSFILDPLNVSWEVDPALGNKLLKGYLPGGENVSTRQTLQALLFAAGAYATTAKSTKLQIKSLTLPNSETVIPNILTDADKVAEQKVTVLPMVTGITILSHDYAKSTTEEDIYSAILEPGYYKIIFQKPFWEITPTGAGDIPTALGLEDGSGFLATENSVNWGNCALIAISGEFEFGPNSIFLTVLETGEVSIKGKPWLDSVRSFSWENPDAIKDYSAGAKYGTAKYGTAKYARVWNTYATPNVWQVENARMVTADEAETVLDKLVNYANLRYQHNVTLFPRFDTEPGDLKLADSLYNKKINGVVEKMRSDLTGGFLIEVDLVGAEKKGN